MRNIFIAGSYRRRQELVERARVLREMGHYITSRWLYDHTEDYPLAKASYEDYSDVKDSDTVIVQLEDPGVGYLTGGRWVEMGIGIAMGSKIMIVGHSERENVHCHFPGVEHYETWDDLYTALKG